MSAANKPYDDHTIADDIEKLEQLLEWFESGDFDVEAALKKYEEGNVLADRIRERLTTIENSITVLEKRFDDTSE